MDLTLLLSPEDADRLPRLPFVKTVRTGRSRTQPVRIVWHDTLERTLAKDGLTLAEERGGWRLERYRPAPTEPWPPATDHRLIEEAAAPDAFNHALPDAITSVAAFEGRKTILPTSVSGETVSITILNGVLRAVAAEKPAARLVLRGTDAAVRTLALSLGEAVELLVPPHALAEEAMHLADGTKPRPRRHGAPALPRDGMSLHGAFSHIVGHLTDIILGLAPLTADAGTGPEPVHQMRVAVRRARSALTLFPSPPAPAASAGTPPNGPRTEIARSVASRRSQTGTFMPERVERLSTGDRGSGHSIAEDRGGEREDFLPPAGEDENPQPDNRTRGRSEPRGGEAHTIKLLTREHHAGEHRAGEARTDELQSADPAADEAHRVATLPGNNRGSETQTAGRRALEANKQPRAATDVTSGLKTLGKMLGPARDWDVFMTETAPPIETALSHQVGLGSLLRTGNRRRRTARSGLAGFLSSPEFRRLSLELACVAAAAEPPEGTASPPLAEFAAHVLHSRWKKLMHAGRSLHDLDNAGLHRVRLKAKRLRYAAEFFAPMFPEKPTARFIRRLSALQERLGEFNDTASADSLLRELSSNPGYAAGLVLGFTAARGVRARSKIAAAWDRFRRGDPFWPTR